VLETSPLKKQAFDKRSRVHSSTIIRRFGGWKEALEAAGLGHLYGGSAVTEKMRAQKGRTSTDPDLLAELHRVAQVVGRNDVVSDDIKQYSDVGVAIFRKRFGTLRAALERAGLEARPLGRRYTDEECFENLKSGNTMAASPAFRK